MKVCLQCRRKFDIAGEDISFLSKLSPSFAGKRYSLPEPNLCEDCRRQRRLLWRNENHLYSRNCDATGKRIISIYHPDSPFTVFDRDYWYDRSHWDAVEYGREYDFNRSFLEQFHELQLNVPRRASNLSVEAENSDFCNLAWHVKDCYMCMNAGYCEACYYCLQTFFSKNVVDCFDLKNSELCYQCFHCNKCYDTYYSENCVNCNGVWLSVDCRGSRNVILCSNLRNKEYHIKNKPCAPREYEEMVQYLRAGNFSVHQEYLDRFTAMKTGAVFNENLNLKVENCLGDYLEECKNCHLCFYAYKTEDCRYIINADHDVRDSMDITNCAEMELCYECIATIGYGNLFSSMVVYGTELLYCDLCEHCNHCFGCIGLHRNEYCILNKQYSRDEYEALVPQIIDQMKTSSEWGEFFPPKYCPFGYNESVASVYSPVSRSEALKSGFRWSDYRSPAPIVPRTMQPSELPESVRDTTDEVLGWAIECERTKRPFRLTSAELKFYRNNGLPIPRVHPDERYLDKMRRRNAPMLHQRFCKKTGREILTTYPQNAPYSVYSTEAYLAEVY